MEAPLAEAVVSTFKKRTRFQTCRTEWHKVLKDCLPDAAIAYLSSQKREPIDHVTRSATVVFALTNRLVEIPGDITFPFRYDTISMTGMPPYKRCLHATFSVVTYNKAVTYLANADTHNARIFAQESYRHIVAALPWQHDDEFKPKALHKDWMSTVELFNDALCTLMLLQTNTTDEATITRHIGVLHTLITHPAIQSIAPKVNEAARNILVSKVIIGWHAFRKDLRLLANQQVVSEESAGAIIATLRPAANLEHINKDLKRAIDVAASAFVGQKYNVQTGNPLAPLAPFEQLKKRYSITSHKLMNTGIELPHSPVSVLGI